MPMALVWEISFFGRPWIRSIFRSYTNAIAAGNTGGIKIPVICEDEEEAIRAALQTCVGADIRNPRIVRIKDTLHLSEIEVSENMLELCQDKENFRILG